ncbi:MAG: tail fiber protein [Bacteroidota bacterium]
MEGTISEIRGFGPTWTPRNWTSCQGQLLPISSNTAFFSLIGTIYGGDGRSTFAVPDLRGRTPIGQGAGPGLTSRSNGQRSGEEHHNLSVHEMPAHNHTAVFTAGAGGGGGGTQKLTVNAISDIGDTNDPTGAYWAAGKSIGPNVITAYKKSGTKVQMAADAVEISGGGTGGGGGAVAVGNNGSSLGHHHAIILTSSGHPLSKAANTASTPHCPPGH